MADAAALATHHDRRLEGRSWISTGQDGVLRRAVEVRHPSLVAPEFVELLRAEGIGLVCAATVAWPRMMDVTAGFVYCRLHGATELYASGYDAPEIDFWAEKIVG